MNKHVNMRLLLGLALSMIFLFGTLAAPVSALQINIVIEKNNQAFASDSNNHTYVYVEPDPLEFVSKNYMQLNEDIDYLSYEYTDSGWGAFGGSLLEDSSAPFDWQQYNVFHTGYYGTDELLPTFYDFIASDGSDSVVNTTLETHTFSLSFGQHTPVFADFGTVYYGTLAISGKEFVHLTVASRQDDVLWGVNIMDPEGENIVITSGHDGDIITIPFEPTMSGTYYIRLEVFPTSGTFALIDFLPEAVSPQIIPAGSVITGELPTGEILIRDDTGSHVHQELAPTVHTYKIDSPDDVASFAYSFNYPELMPLTQSVGIVSTHGGGAIGGSQGEFFFRGGPYYVTVYGGDNVEYTLYHNPDNDGELQLNQEFRIENYLSAPVFQCYTLDIMEPSTLRLNSTATGGELDVFLTGLTEDEFRVRRHLNFQPTINAASDYYLLPGEYYVTMEMAPYVNEWVEFNIGSFVNATNATIVDLGGFYLDTELFQLYNLTCYLNNQDNITVVLDITLYDASGSQLTQVTRTLANWWDGSQILPNPLYPNNFTVNYDTRYHHDTYAFVELCAYSVVNNTQGAINGYEDYPLDITIEWERRLNDFFANIEELEVSTSADSANTTLPLASPANYYGYLLNTTPGTWYNVSVKSSDVSSFSSILYSEYFGRTHTIPWGHIGMFATGTEENLTFEFGAISSQLFLQVLIGRDLIADGFIWIEITPLETHQLSIDEIPPMGSDLLSMLGGIVIPVAIGVVVVVLVVVVYVKKFKK